MYMYVNKRVELTQQGIALQKIYVLLTVFLQWKKNKKLSHSKVCITYTTSDFCMNAICLRQCPLFPIYRAYTFPQVTSSLVQQPIREEMLLSLQVLEAIMTGCQSMLAKLPAELKSVVGAAANSCRCAVTASRRSV